MLELLHDRQEISVEEGLGPDHTDWLDLDRAPRHPDWLSANDASAAGARAEAASGSSNDLAAMDVRTEEAPDETDQNSKRLRPSYGPTLTRKQIIPQNCGLASRDPSRLCSRFPPPLSVPPSRTIPDSSERSLPRHAIQASHSRARRIAIAVHAGQSGLLRRTSPKVCVQEESITVGV